MSLPLFLEFPKRKVFNFHNLINDNVTNVQSKEIGNDVIDFSPQKIKDWGKHMVR